MQKTHCPLETLHRKNKGNFFPPSFVLFIFFLFPLFFFILSFFPFFFFFLGGGGERQKKAGHGREGGSHPREVSGVEAEDWKNRGGVPVGSQERLIVVQAQVVPKPDQSSPARSPRSRPVPVIRSPALHRLPPIRNI
jgi:hypothetical protein